MIDINKNSLDKYEAQSQTKNIFPLDINIIAIEIGTLKNKFQI